MKDKKEKKARPLTSPKMINAMTGVTTYNENNASTKEKVMRLKDVEGLRKTTH